MAGRPPRYMVKAHVDDEYVRYLNRHFQLPQSEHFEWADFDFPSGDPRLHGPDPSDDSRLEWVPRSSKSDEALLRAHALVSNTNLAVFGLERCRDVDYDARGIPNPERIEMFAFR